jgi:hypothetical protein
VAVERNAGWPVSGCSSCRLMRLVFNWPGAGRLASLPATGASF